MLYEKFGEFDSAEEINAAADGQRAEGDTDAILTIAQENGLDREDAQDFIDGVTPELCSPLSAALGKLKIESAELKPAGDHGGLVILHHDPLWGKYGYGGGSPEERQELKRLHRCATEMVVWQSASGRQRNFKGSRRHCRPLHTRHPRNSDGTPDHNRILSGKVGGRHEKKSD